MFCQQNKTDQFQFSTLATTIMKPTTRWRKIIAIRVANQWLCVGEAAVCGSKNAVPFQVKQINNVCVRILCSNPGKTCLTHLLMTALVKWPSFEDRTSLATTLSPTLSKFPLLASLILLSELFQNNKLQKWFFKFKFSFCEESRSKQR